jgi:hypothetical protein
MQRALLLFRLCLCALLAQSAFSAAQENKATPSAVSTEPHPGIAQDTSPPSAKTSPAGSAPAVGTLPHIALLLPLASKAFAPLANALRSGWAAAAAFDGRNALPYRIYVSDNEGDALSGQFHSAVNEGALLVTAGLTRDGATLLARLALQENSSRVPVLALNAPDVAAPSRFYFLSLSLDNEARQTAQFAYEEGAKSVAIVSSASALSRRIAEGFEKEWLRSGGEIAARIAFAGDPADAPRLRDKLENLRSDIVFLAAGPGTARIARPYIPIWMQIYATSLSFDSRADTVANIDLEGVRFLEMPWFVQPDHPAVMIYPRPGNSTPVEQERLYALGIDAWRLASQLARAGERGAALDGVTGKLTLDSSGQYSRALLPAEFHDGRAQVSRHVAE